jgi:hypothetical protein
MKKLLAASLLAATLLLPAASASASEIPEPAGVDPCGPGRIGVIVWHYDPREMDYVYYRFCIYIGP